jgi:dTDP-4-dehydrorhamnose reductase
MKIIILGNGNAGKYINNFLSESFECIVFTRKDFNAASTDFKFLTSILNPGDIVINCVGILKPNINIVGVENTFLINSTFPNSLNQICDSNNSHFIHICSDCVFAGDKGNYNEDDITDAKDIYAISKKLVKSGTIIRTSFIGKYSGLLKWVLENENKSIDGYDNCIWNGVTALELAKFIKENIVNNTLWQGVKHLHSPFKISKYELCKLINNIYSLNIDIKKTLATSIENQKINKILDRSLSTKFNLNINSLEVQLNEMKIFDEKYSK